MKPRICFLSSMHPPLDKRVFQKQACLLAERGYEVYHLAPHLAGDRPSEFVEKNVHLVTYRPSIGLTNRLRNLFFLYQTALKINAKIYHCNEIDSWMVGVALRLLNKKICIFDAHEHYPEEFSEKRAPLVLRPLIKFSISTLMKVLALFTHRVVVAKKSILKDFVGLSEERLVVVENFSSLSIRQIDPSKNIMNGPLKLIHLGLFNKYRGWPQLLEAINLCGKREIHLLVLGEINDGTEAEFLEQIRRLKFDNKVVYRRWVSYEKAIEFTKEAHVGIICFQPGFYNHVYALPHKLFDYMSCALPVIVPNMAVEVSSIVRKTDCGICVDVSDPTSIANAIIKLYENRNLILSYGANGHDAVLDYYNWETQAKKMLKLYDDVSKI